MRHHRTAIVLVSFILTAGAAATAAGPKTSERYAFSTFREQAGRVSVFVDGYPGSQRTTDAYVPIPIAIAVTNNGKAIEFLPESFTLVDAKGNAVPAAGYQELIRGYEKLGFDRSLTRMRPIVVGSYVADLRRIDASFYPPSESGTRTARAELGPFTWFADTFYFPRPPAGLDGVLTLRVAIPGFEPVEVRFVATAEELARR
jgi:hypothetical protein